MLAEQPKWAPWAESYKCNSKGKYISWREHPIESIKGLEGLRIGTFPAERMDQVKVWYERASAIVPPSSDKIGNDLHFLSAAFEHLEEERKRRPAPAPIMSGAPQSDPDDPEPLDTEERPGLATQPSPNAQRASPSETLASLKAKNGALMDPRLIKTAEQFRVWIEGAAENLSQTQDFMVARKLGQGAEIARAIMEKLHLGEELEQAGRRLRFEAYYRARELYGNPPAGRPKIDEEGDAPPFSTQEKRLMSTLAHFGREQFEKIVQEACEAGSLSEQTFRRLIESPKKKSQIDPRDKAFYAFWDAVIADPVRFAQGGYYKEGRGEWAKRFMAHSSVLRTAANKILELLGPE